MKRIKINPRKDYVEKIESLGFNFHPDYWKEDAYYEFTEEEIMKIEKASFDCYDMYCKAVEHVIKNNLWDKLCIPRKMVPAIIKSWENDELSLYGRFDFAMVKGIPKLLEFNADTPTSLLEASVIQWHWKEEMLKGKDQFNSIHENLIQSWEDIAEEYFIDGPKIDFVCIDDNLEDFSNTAYLCSTATEAGINTAMYDISQMRYLDDQKCHAEPSNLESPVIFKLYPWEWIFNEEGSDLFLESETIFIEPMWKAILSNKYMLVILAELFPNNPYILKASDNPLESGSFCKKPIFSREGANVTLVKDGKTIDESEGEYGEEGFIYQELVELEDYDGMYPILGSWIIGGVACGMGIRENKTRITNNMSYFVPHVF